MKLTSILLVMFALTFVASGQTMSKSEKKALKDKAKAEKKAAEEERKSISVDFNQLTKFPQSYLGRTLRLYRIGLGEIRPYTDAGITYYPISLIATEATATIPLSDSVTFIMTESLARPVVTEIDRIKYKTAYGSNRIPIGDVYFEVIQKDVEGRRFFLAKVSCVAVIDFFAEQKRTALGECPLVK